MTNRSKTFSGWVEYKSTLTSNTLILNTLPPDHYVHHLKGAGRRNCTSKDPTLVVDRDVGIFIELKRLYACHVLFPCMCAQRFPGKN